MEPEIEARSRLLRRPWWIALGLWLALAAWIGADTVELPRLPEPWG
jgi:hypothetical protein